MNGATDWFFECLFDYRLEALSGCLWFELAFELASEVIWLAHF